VATLVASSQYPRDRVLWILTEHGGKMERSRLRAKAAMRYSQLDPILDELVKEGRIRISGEIITVMNETYNRLVMIYYERGIDRPKRRGTADRMAVSVPRSKHRSYLGKYLGVTYKLKSRP
jgi:hypothetical protein